MNLVRAERDHGGSRGAFKRGVEHDPLEAGCAKDGPAAAPASGLPPSDLRKRPTAEPVCGLSSSWAIAITSFWQIEPPEEVQ